MLWEVVIRPTEDQPDREADRVLQEAQNFQAASIRDLQSARSFLIQTSESQAAVERVAVRLLVDSVVETWDVQPVAANGQQVSAGDTIVVLEAMKMEQPLTAHQDGTVSGLTVGVGQTVSAGAVICELGEP